MQGELIRKGERRNEKAKERWGQRKREISKQSDINHNNHNPRARHDKEVKKETELKKEKWGTLYKYNHNTATGIVVMLIY